MQEVFGFVKIFNQPLPKGDRVAVITNGGGMGVLTADAIEQEGMVIADFSEETKAALRKILPPYGNVGNPLDLVADAGVDAYGKAIEVMMADPGMDSLALVILTQTPQIDERIIGVLTGASDDRRKAVVTISVGGAYTEAYQRALESKTPVRIAGRCTVFAESDIIHKQQMGHRIEDIIYGLCQALVRNYLNNVGLEARISRCLP